MLTAWTIHYLIQSRIPYASEGTVVNPRVVGIVREMIVPCERLAPEADGRGAVAVAHPRSLSRPFEFMMLLDAKSTDPIHSRIWIPRCLALNRIASIAS